MWFKFYLFNGGPAQNNKNINHTFFISQLQLKIVCWSDRCLILDSSQIETDDKLWIKDCKERNSLSFKNLSSVKQKEGLMSYSLNLGRTKLEHTWISLLLILPRQSKKVNLGGTLKDFITNFSSLTYSVKKNFSKTLSEISIEENIQKIQKKIEALRILN
jgi:hypothetical protein